MPGGATWSWAFQVMRSRAFRVARVRSGSEWVAPFGVVRTTRVERAP
jgi:hypothetical protein